MPAVPAVEEAAGQLEDLDEPPEPRVRGAGGRASLMKPLVVLALPGMYLFYKYSQYRREQRELSRRRVTERELQHLHHKIDKLLTKLEKNEPELASSQEDELEIDGASLESSSSSSSSESSLREKRSTADDFLPCDPSNGPPCDLPMPPPKPPGMPGPPNPPESGMQPGGSQMREKRAAQGPPAGGPGPEGGMDGMMGGAVGVAGAMASTMGDAFNTGVDAMSQMGKRIGNIMSGAKM